MGDYYCRIVPENVDINKVEKIADLFVKHLADRKIIELRKKDNTLDSESGFPPGSNYKEIVTESEDHFLALTVNGLAVIKERTVFDGGSVDHIYCQNCGYDIIDQDWSAYIQEWFDSTGKDIVECENCHSRESITLYTFHPTWAFGYLGFVFWNWPIFKEEFFKEIEKVINRKIRVIYGKL